MFLYSFKFNDRRTVCKQQLKKIYSLLSQAVQEAPFLLSRPVVLTKINEKFFDNESNIYLPTGPGSPRSPSRPGCPGIPESPAGPLLRLN